MARPLGPKREAARVDWGRPSLKRVLALGRDEAGSATGPAASPECRDSAPAPSEFRTGELRRELPVPRSLKAAPLLSHRGGTGDSCPRRVADVRSSTPGTGGAVATTSGATRRSHPPDPTPACVRRSSPSSPCLQFATLGSHLHPRHRSPVGAGGGAPRGRSCVLKDPGLLP